jgi:hypothetical protein
MSDSPRVRKPNAFQPRHQRHDPSFYLTVEMHETKISALDSDLFRPISPFAHAPPAP